MDEIVVESIDTVNTCIKFELYMLPSVVDGFLLRKNYLEASITLMLEQMVIQMSFRKNI